ncbi:unnamed protein product [Sphenostylis stenocarpa]|uniref:Cation/H(+) antiporter C-terminal domain-containing protein n=1 Tax=Sphenostylis stenocarpa TaxID=92480 RepID=A0AA86VCU1_9FABA|nr:unnamed protein product [Sphenostylis stenocarpa]
MATTSNNPSCPAPMKATSNGAFQHENPLDYALPLLILQICLVVAFTRFIAFLCKPLRQPRVVAEIIVSFSFPALQWSCTLALMGIAMILVFNFKFVTPPGTSLAFGARLVGVSSNKDRKTVDAVDDNNYADKKQDDELWSKFLSACNNNQESMKYEEKLVQSKGDIETTLKDMKRSNLILVGRMPSVAPLGSQSDCPELGPVGSFLASSDYSTVTSVMVIQQYNPSTDIHPLVMEESDFPEMSDTPRS